MNTRLEIAAMLVAGGGYSFDGAVRHADILIAEEARTRPYVETTPAAAIGSVVQELSNLRAVAEELMRALAVNDARADDNIGPAAYEEALVRLGWNKTEGIIRFERRLTIEALKRARAIGLGGGR